MISAITSIKTLWQVDKLHFILICYFVLVYSWMYRVALRTLFDGDSFRWVNLLNVQLMGEEQRAFIAGNGVDGHFIVILLFAKFSVALLYLLIRRPDGFARTLFLGWIVIFLIHQLTLSFGLGSEYVIRGDTMGLVLPFYIIGPVQHVLMLLLALLWMIKEPYENRLCYPSLDSERKIWLKLILSLYLPIFFLFRFGEQHGLTDQLGIILLYMQAILLIFGLFHFELKEPDNA